MMVLTIRSGDDRPLPTGFNHIIGVGDPASRDQGQAALDLGAYWASPARPPRLVREQSRAGSARPPPRDLDAAAGPSGA
jgi:hypothetical protein